MNFVNFHLMLHLLFTEILYWWWGSQTTAHIPKRFSIGLSSGVFDGQFMWENFKIKFVHLIKSLNNTKKRRSLNRSNAEMPRALQHRQLLSPLRPTTKPSQCCSLSILTAPSVFLYHLCCPETTLRATSSYFTPVYNLHSDMRVDKWADCIYWRGNDRSSVKICARSKC